MRYFLVLNLTLFIGSPAWLAQSLVTSLVGFGFGGGAISFVAQEGDPDGPVYGVQGGDTLGEIASQFGVLLDDLKIMKPRLRFLS